MWDLGARGEDVTSRTGNPDRLCVDDEVRRRPAGETRGGRGGEAGGRAGGCWAARRRPGSGKGGGGGERGEGRAGASPAPLCSRTCRSGRCPAGASVGGSGAPLVGVRGVGGGGVG